MNYQMQSFKRRLSKRQPNVGQSFPAPHWLSRWHASASI